MRSGGSYDNRNGEMKRVSGTRSHPEGNRPRDAQGRPADLPNDTETVTSATPNTVKKTVKKTAKKTAKKVARKQS